ncbi:uncharacterized, partial [Tachysurus ichikawai]
TLFVVDKTEQVLGSGRKAVTKGASLPHSDSQMKARPPLTCLHCSSDVQREMLESSAHCLCLYSEAWLLKDQRPLLFALNSSEKPG